MSRPSKRPLPSARPSGSLACSRPAKVPPFREIHTQVISFMTRSETEIMRHFRRFEVGVGQMLFFDTGPARAEPASFHSAMTALIRQGLVVEERPRGAYSLTESGYIASLASLAAR